jgi:amino-acid N-acetyltransferase
LSSRTPSIAFARPDELPAIRRLLAACGLPHDDFQDDAVTFLVAREGKDLAGVAGLESLGTLGLLRSVAVSPARRDKGVARALCNAVLDHARGTGVQRVFLLTAGAERYFDRLGFAVTGRDALPAEIRATSEFRVACPQTAIAMQRDL